MDLSGTWGYDDLPFLDLKFDGARKVSGTTYWRAGGRSTQAVITEGSFDLTAHALRLEGDAPALDGKGESHYVIDGTLENGTLSGTYDCGGLKGNFTFTRIGARKD